MFSKNNRECIKNPVPLFKLCFSHSIFYLLISLTVSIFCQILFILTYFIIKDYGVKIFIFKKIHISFPQSVGLKINMKLPFYLVDTKVHFRSIIYA